MRSTKSIVLIVIALGCGLVASIGISEVMENRATSSSLVETEAIYVAATNVPSYEKLTTLHVQIEEWPKDKIPQGTARSLEEFEGMRPRVPLYPGEPIMMSKLSDGTSGSAAERIPEGMQVFTVKVDKESALSGLVLPGDRVDVLVFIRGSSGRDGIRTGTRTILRNVSVFAVNDQIGRNEDDVSIDAKTVSLLVQPEQSERLLLAKQLGTIHLALRKPGDKTNIETSGAVPSDLIDSVDSVAATKDDSKPAGGIFAILNNIKGPQTPSADSSSAAFGPVQEMVIMTPQGVKTYSWPSENSNSLPRELLGAYGESRPSSGDSVDTDLETDFDSDIEADDSETSAQPSSDDDSEGMDEDDFDPADVGL